jgi:putative DNA methylase
MTDFPRLIEHAFPLKEASLDSVHEKNVRHGHISTLHIWPARRPLAACRAALIATLLPDPGDAEKRKELCEKIAGKVVKKIERKKMPNGQTVERVKEETEGGILHWGRETENAETLEWFRQEIRKAYGGRAPKVLDPFAGGGAIPLEAMRLGCEATAVDINPVAWFILKCTLEYPQKLASQTRPLPEFILHNDAFMAEFFAKAKGYSKSETKAAVNRLHELLKKKVKWNQKPGQKDFAFQQQGDQDGNELQADLAWHVRAWGQWVLDRARRELAQYYPTYADFEPLIKDKIAYEHQPMRLVPLNDDGTSDIESLNAELTQDYLDDKRNPRWVAKPTVAYLWARTVTCKNCRATVPLLKTLWLCKKDNRRVLLTLSPNATQTGVTFGIDENVPSKGGNPAQRREHDKRLGAGTMSKAGADCPCCQKRAVMTMEDIRVEARDPTRRLGAILTALVVDGPEGKEFRAPTEIEQSVLDEAQRKVDEIFSEVPFGAIVESTPRGGGTGACRAFSVQGYGLMQWRDLFVPRQLAALGVFVNVTRRSRELMKDLGYAPIWVEGVSAFLACGLDRLADRSSSLCRPDPTPTQSGVINTFSRFALPVTWDFIEGNTLLVSSGGYLHSLEWVAKVCEQSSQFVSCEEPQVKNRSVLGMSGTEYDIIVTDPPYYDAIPYSDLMDFFYVWLRRTLNGLTDQFDMAFKEPLAPKWNADENDGELIDDDSRHGGDSSKSKQVYEDGMARAFRACHMSLREGGRLVVVFANKHPDAWETLVSALIRAGFIVDGSWPIRTEMSNRMRALTSAALASSVWLVCKKRPETARPGWDNKVLEEMRRNISVQLREFWDADIRGPNFVWAATGPALEAYSKHPVVRKANEPNTTMGVGEFLNHVRRMVVDYIVGQVLSGEHGADMAAADRLDEVTAYYLLHRNDFKTDEAPIGACILYATACGLSDAELEKTWNILTHAGGGAAANDEDNDGDEDSDGDAEPEDDSGGGSKVKLKPWNQRQHKSMGNEAPEGKAVPLIDRIHRVMHLWKDGDVQKVDEYLDQHALRRNELFKRVVQSLIELSTNSERSLLESISNHIGAKGAVKDRGPALPFSDDE